MLEVEKYNFFLNLVPVAIETALKLVYILCKFFSVTFQQISNSFFQYLPLNLHKCWISLFQLKIMKFGIFSCDQAALQMVFSVSLSVRLSHLFSCDKAALQMVFSVCLSVCLSHLFDYVPIIVSSWNFQELLPMTKVRCMQKVKVKGQGHRGHNPT